MSRPLELGTALRTVAAFVVLGSLVAGCDSNNDDDGGDTGGDPTVPMTPGGMNGGLDSSDSFADIVARGPTDEPYELGNALGADLQTAFGGATDEPVDVEDGEGIDAVASRRASPAR